jgi:hypothetical protein
LQKKQFFPEVKDAHFTKDEENIYCEFTFENKTITANIFGQENLEYIALALQIAIDM